MPPPPRPARPKRRPLRRGQPQPGDLRLERGGSRLPRRRAGAVAGREVLRLDENHRSSPQIVAAASSALGRHAVTVRSSQPDGPAPRLRSYPSEVAEATSVASQLLEAHARGLRWVDMAVLADQFSGRGDQPGLEHCGHPLPRLATTEGPPWKRGRSQSVPGDGPGDVVTVCSFHPAKGLQWAAVWICGLEAGFVPIAYASALRPSPRNDAFCTWR